MRRSAQKRAIENYRSRLANRGIARFEIQAPDADRQLIRTVARKLTEPGPEADKFRRALREVIGEASNAGGILAALRRSPLVGADLDLRRRYEPGRKVDL
jgi:hypothetical protein